MSALPGMLMLAMALCPPAQAVQFPQTGQSVSLGWNASPDPAVVGYIVYDGGASGNYTNSLSVGTATNAIFFGLVDGATYYFAVAAVDTNGVESDFSNEVVYAVPPVVVELQISGAAGGVFSLTGTGVAGHTYDIQATTDWVAWTTIGARTVGSFGSFEFIDDNASNHPARFYRLQDTQP